MPQIDNETVLQLIHRIDRLEAQVANLSGQPLPPDHPYRKGGGDVFGQGMVARGGMLRGSMLDREPK